MADIAIDIGNNNYPSWSMRPWLALKHSGVSFEDVTIRPAAAAAGSAMSPATRTPPRRHWPRGGVPVLRHGATIVWESLAICGYRAERFPAVPLRRAMQGRAAMAEWIAAAKVAPWVIRYDVSAGTG